MPVAPSGTTLDELAVVFDWDGILANSQGAYVEAFRVTLAKYGYQTTGDDERALPGKAFPDCLQYFESKLQRELTDFERHWRQDFDSRISKGVDLFDDAVACLSAVVDRSLPAAVATQTPRVQFDQALGVSGLASFLSFTICRDEVPRPKPAPDLYVAACEGLGFPPNKCLAVEDSLTGVESAKGAGLLVLAVARDKADFAALDSVGDFTVNLLSPRRVFAALEFVAHRSRNRSTSES